jgi:hypothetical protein
VKTKAIVAGAVVLVVLFFLAMLLIVSRKPAQAIAVRHVKSVQSGNVTTMTFEIKNHTANPYVFVPYEVQVRNGDVWIKFQTVDDYEFLRKRSVIPAIGPTGLVYRTMDVTNLPAKSVVRVSMRSSKQLLGLSGLFMRAKLNWEFRGSGPHIPLNPFDSKSSPWGKPTEVTSDEFVETVK